jgi:hypothetical protein
MPNNKKTEKESKTETKSYILKEVKVATITNDKQPKIPEPTSKNIKKNDKSE